MAKEVTVGDRSDAVGGSPARVLDFNLWYIKAQGAMLRSDRSPDYSTSLKALKYHGVLGSFPRL